MPPTIASPSPPAAPAPHRADLLRTIAEGTAAEVGAAFLRSLARHLAVAFGAEVAFVSELLPGEHARVVAAWPADGALPEGHVYPLAGTPCEAVLDHAIVSYPSGTMRRFPRDAFIAEHCLDGYLAVALRASDGTLAGYLAVSSTRRLEAAPEDLAVLQIFGARAGDELERRRQEALLRAHESEVAAARMRLVHAADEERRRIGRDLHDGAQQRLVALGHWLEVALRRLEGGGDVRDLLAEARDQAREAAVEVRDLARGLHPAGLSAAGLAGALRALALRSSLPVRLRALPERRLPDPLAVTVFCLVSEGLANAVEHAGATELSVAVEQRGGFVHVDVADDGAGGATTGGGGGLCGLADRVAALGGRLAVESPAGGGTRLRASIPLAPCGDALAACA